MWLVEQLRDAEAGIFGVAGIATNGFCCPLCVRVLPKTCATVAHAPSREVGGKGQTFLCKACNSFLGTAYEAGVDEYIADMRSGTAGVKRKITLSRDTGPRLYYDAVFSGEKGTKRISAEPRRRNKQAEQRFNAAKTDDEKLVIQFRFAGEANIKLAYLSWAHLLLFRELGFTYIFSDAGRLARSALLTSSTKQLSPAFFLVRGTYKGETSPIVTGILMRFRRREVERSSFVGIAAEIGPAIVALPLAGDPHGEYGRLFDYVADKSAILVLPLDEIFDGHVSLIRGIAGYGLQDGDGVHRIFAVRRMEAMKEVATAAPPPTRRPSEAIPPPRSGWPPPVLPLPPLPRAETWRMTAGEYLTSRGVEIAATSDEEAWIDAIRSVDRVAARHVQDMRDLFALGHDPRSRPPKGFSELSELNDIAATVDADARIVGGDFRAISPGDGFASHSVRLLRGGVDLVIGPHYRYETLVYAVRVALDAS
jgi:hypothetical protein